MTTDITSCSPSTSLLYNESETIKFLEQTIPQLKDDEILILALGIDGKYHNIKPGTIINSSFIINNDIDNIMTKIRRLSYVEKCYRVKNTGNYIDPKNMAIYMDIQPRNVIKGISGFIKSYMDKLNETALNPSASNTKDFKKFISWTKMRNAMIKSISRKIYCDININIKNYELLEKVIKSIRNVDLDNSINMEIIEAKDGFHIIVPNNEKIISEAYKLHMYFEGVEICNQQCQIPIPGTYQGGFKVKLINIGDIL